MMLLCLGLVGCTMFGKKPPNANPSPPAPLPPGPRPGFGGPPPPDPPGSANANAPYNGILAGQVLDSYNRKPPRTSIKVVQTKDKDGKDHAPIEFDGAWTDASGYFVIQGLQPGKSYQLVAVAKDGDRKLAGATWARPPDPRVLIRISEDLVTPTTADPPSSPGSTRPNKPTESSHNNPTPSWPDNPATAGWQPYNPGGASSPITGAGGAQPRPVEMGNPVPRSGNGPVDKPIVIRPEMTGNIPSHVDRRSAPADTPTRPESGGMTPTHGMPTGSAPVPFCVLLSRNKLDNFALNDLNGQPWEFKKDRRGKLVLLDFWATNCVPCLHSIPHLKDWNRRYTSYGLEIVSIAYDAGTLEDQIRKVRGIRDSRQIDYRILLGANPSAKCPVRNQFQVQYYPLVVLLDESGQILWRSGNEGLGLQQLRELEFEINRGLGLR